MAEIDANIVNIQHSLNQLLERVFNGEVLTKEEAQAFLQIRANFDRLKQCDTYKEVMRGTKLKELTDKWSCGEHHE